MQSRVMSYFNPGTSQQVDIHQAKFPQGTYIWRLAAGIITKYVRQFANSSKNMENIQ